MILQRLFNTKLAQASYILACDHTRQALIVDPDRDIARYIDALKAQNLQLVAITETHIHADFISGSRELASVTGAQLYLSGEGGEDWTYRFTEDASATILHDGSTLEVGQIRVQALHTPGHTPEHMIYYLSSCP